MKFEIKINVVDDYGFAVPLAQPGTDRLNARPRWKQYCAATIMGLLSFAK
jgi:hypothetical protein